MNRQSGFTLVELLVVIAIVVLLLQLSLPAIAAAREAARRATCQNKMRQLAVAVRLHHSSHQHYPPGRFLGKFGEGPDSRAWSWLAVILPQLEMGDLYKQGDIPRATLRSSEIADRYVPNFICPSIPENHIAPRQDAGNLIGFPVGNSTYKGVSGANWGADMSLGLEDFGTIWRNIGTNGSYDGLDRGDGILWRSDIDRRIRDAHVKDGLAKTLLVGEDRPSHNIWCSWPYSNNAYGTCAIPPNVVPKTSWQYDTYSFRSAHPGGLNFAFADGTIQFINGEISLSVYRALATRNGAETDRQ